MKQVLLLHYSQSGQLTDILNKVSQDLVASNEVTITSYKLQMEEEFPFPWNKEAFFGVFPETFLQIPAKLKPIPPEILNQQYDLIILGYTVWYLSPSIPTNSFLKSKEAKQLLANTPVITVIGCRNMWIMAQEKVKKLLVAIQANLMGNIVLSDRHLNHISVITISKWMFSGKKERFLGVFPKPGISEKDITESSKFGKPILKHLINNDFSDLQASLLKLNAVKIKPFLITVDKRANILFGKWATLIASKGDKNNPKRKFWVKMFNKYLLFAIWLIAPIVFILFLLSYLPLQKKIKNDKAYYKSVNLKEK
ncbi:MAG: dialkylresorcinol condensing enzyme DarA [Flavobacteriales bacterium]